MRVNNTDPLAVRTNIAPATGARGSQRRKADEADFTSAEHLKRSLEATPEVRSEKVERAKALLADPSYPSKKMTAKIAEVLAREFSSGRE